MSSTTTTVDGHYGGPTSRTFDTPTPHLRYPYRRLAANPSKPLLSVSPPVRRDVYDGTPGAFRHVRVSRDKLFSARSAVASVPSYSSAAAVCAVVNQSVHANRIRRSPVVRRTRRTRRPHAEAIRLFRGLRARVFVRRLSAIVSRGASAARRVSRDTSLDSDTTLLRRLLRIAVELLVSYLSVAVVGFPVYQRIESSCGPMSSRESERVARHCR